MWLLQQSRLEAEALEVHVARAGWALACPYSSAEEFEAAVISARRRAAIPRRRWRVAGTLAGTALLALLIWLV